MKKSIKYMSFALLAFLVISLRVNATDANLNLQCDEGIISVFKIGGNVLFIIKIVVPILLIVTASVDMFKAVIGSDQDLVLKQTQIIIKRGIAAIIVFLLPSIIYFAFTSLVNIDSDLEKFDNLGMCLKEPGSCQKAASCPSE